MMKLCSCCDTYLKEAMFYKRPNRNGKRAWLSHYCKPCHIKQNKKYKANLSDSEKQRVKQLSQKYHKSRWAAVRKEVFLAYGGFMCVCCGESRDEFLAIDHVAGNGNKHRREIKKEKGHSALYFWLKKYAFPSGFQVLCHSCNFAKSHGGCPHKHRRQDEFTISPFDMEAM